jgi:hypothetical protein
MKKTSAGYTIVELVVVVPSMIIILAVITALMVTLYTDLLKKNGELDLQISAQSALFTIRDDPYFAIRFAGTNQDDTTDTYAPSGGWNAITNNAFIVYEASFNANRETTTRQLIYKKDQPNACNSPDITENQFSLNTLIYFNNGGKLYRRVLIPNQTTNCATTFRLQTCPSNHASSTCPKDVLVADNVQSFSINYYDQDGNQLSSSALQANPDMFIQAKRADMTLTLQKNVNAQPITASANISIKKVE